jgi:hypothetical protein
MPSAECLRSWLYSSIQAATAARASAFVPNVRTGRSSNSKVECQDSMTALSRAEPGRPMDWRMPSRWQACRNLAAVYLVPLGVVEANLLPASQLPMQVYLLLQGPQKPPPRRSGSMRGIDATAPKRESAAIQPVGVASAASTSRRKSTTVSGSVRSLGNQIQATVHPCVIGCWWIACIALAVRTTQDDCSRDEASPYRAARLRDRSHKHYLRRKRPPSRLPTRKRNASPSATATPAGLPVGTLPVASRSPWRPTEKDTTASES